MFRPELKKGGMKPNAGPHSRRPDNSAFKQQRLPAWSPMLTPHTVLPFFYFTAAICLVLGVWLWLTVKSTQELKLDYTTDGTCNLCFDKLQNASGAAANCTCTLVFEVDKRFKGDVFFYYGLRNFHQNLRRYMDSRDDTQMVGRKKKLTNPSQYCEPFRKDPKGIPIAPCGAVANSLFNDSFRFFYHGSGVRPMRVPLLRRGIAWYTDKNIKFRNPPLGNSTLAEAFKGTAKPLYWQKPVFERNLDDPNDNGFINEDFIVWMREAAFPNFKKLYGFLNRSRAPFTNGLPAGTYSVEIDYNFPPQHFKGRKLVVLTTLTWFGGQNHFLPVVYLVSSCLLLVLAVVLTVVWWKFGRNGQNLKE